MSVARMQVETMSIDAAMVVVKNTIVCCGVMANILSPSCNLTFPTYNYTGHPLGIIDSKGKVIAKPAYSRIQYLGRGLYLTREAGVGLDVGNRYTLLNRDGKQIQPKLPQGMEFAGVYHLGSLAADKSTRSPGVLPPDAVIVFRREGKLGLCATDGQQLLDAKYGTVESVNEGQPLIFEMAVRMTYPDRENGIDLEDARNYRSNKGFYFDVANHELIQLKQTGIWALSPDYSDGMRSFCCAQTKNLHGFLDARGAVAIKPRYIRYEPFKDGRAVVTVYPAGSGSQYGDRFIIDKAEKRISPKGIFVIGRMNDLYLTGMTKKSGILDKNGKWLFPPANGMIRAQPDGTLLHEDGATRTQISSTGQVLKTTRSEIAVQSNSRSQETIRCIPKQAGTEEVELSKWKRAKQLAQNMLWFPSGRAQFLGMEHTTYPQNVTPGKDLEEKQRPYFALTRFEPNRFAMIAPGYMGKFDPAQLKINEFNGATHTDMFARFLREYNLFSMSKTEVIKLLADSNENATITATGLELGIVSGGCIADDYIRVQIRFDGDKVQSWNFADGNNQTSPSITHDVTLVPVEVTTDRDKIGREKSIFLTTQDQAMEYFARHSVPLDSSSRTAVDRASLISKLCRKYAHCNDENMAPSPHAELLIRHLQTLECNDLSAMEKESRTSRLIEIDDRISGLHLDISNLTWILLEISPIVPTRGFGPSSTNSLQPRYDYSKQLLELYLKYRQQDGLNEQHCKPSEGRSIRGRDRK